MTAETKRWKIVAQNTLGILLVLALVWGAIVFLYDLLSYFQSLR